MIKEDDFMYKLVVINRFGVATEIRGNDLERLKNVRKRKLNKKN